MNTLIAFTGKKRSGKTTAAEFTKFRHINFADPLKTMLRAYFRSLELSEDMIHELMEGEYKEKATPHLGQRTPRYAMQTLGTEWGRQLIYDGLWTDAYKTRVRQWSKVTTSDLRFLNEAKTIRELGGKIVRVVRPGLISNDSHASEIEMDSITPDWTIVNDGSLQELQKKVQAFLA